MPINIDSEDIKIQDVVDLMIYMEHLNIKYTLKIITREEEEHEPTR